MVGLSVERMLLVVSTEHMLSSATTFGSVPILTVRSGGTWHWG
jgi:hypothetical protein